MNGKHVRLLIWFLFVLTPCFGDYATAGEFYLPPSVYRTLDSRHRSYFPQPAGKSIPITAHVAYTSDLEEPPKVTLFYRVGMGPFNAVSMHEIDEKKWKAEIPGEHVNADTIYYYLQVDDNIIRATAPESDPREHPFKISVDFSFDENAPPIIELMPRTRKMNSIAQCKKENILIAAYIVDNAAPLVENVGIRFYVDRNEKSYSDNLTDKSDYLWNVLIPWEKFSSSLEFRILAVESASSDTTIWPPMDSSSFKIQIKPKCSIVPPFIHLTMESLSLTVDEDGSPLPFQKEIQIDAFVTSSEPLSRGSVNLYYKPLFLTDYAKTTFEQTELDSIWTATIPAVAAMDTIKFYVELVQGKDEVTDPIWMGRDKYYEIPIKFPNTPPIITRTPPTIALGDAPQPSGAALPIEAVIVDAVEPFVQSALLFYRHLDSASWDSVAMVNIADSTWRAEIPAEVVSPDSVYYYLFATDGELNGHAPDIAQPREKPFVIPVKTPNAPPIITRTPETVALGDSPRPVHSTLRIEAVIVDTLGPSVQSAMLYYRHPGQTLYDSLAMSHVADSTWRGDIPCNAVVPDSIYYYLSASDGDSTGYDPKSKPPGEPPYAIFVAGENPPPEIIHQPTPTATADSVIQVTALVSDATLYVATVELYYQNRRDGKNFKRMDMFNTGSDRYSVVIPGDVVIPPYVNYYIKAGDECQSTASTPIFHVLVDAGDVVMPNPFTPNGDGFNDYAFFNVPGLRQGRGRVNIYNLRGRLVRQLFDSGKWYGKDDSGAELPPGVYIYAVYVDGKRTSKGTLTLIR